MREKKLTEQELKGIRERSAKNQGTWEYIQVRLLLDHIDAMEAEYQAGMRKVIDDAFRQGEATTKFIESQKLSGEHAETVMAIFREIERQNTKWGDQSHHLPELWYAILGEEVGEVAKAILEKKPDELVKELVEVAAVSVQMIRAMQIQKKANDPE
jgi:NTP pyrophosphatase (non-canonical NTP hydrolase)